MLIWRVHNADNEPLLSWQSCEQHRSQWSENWIFKPWLQPSHVQWEWVSLEFSHCLSSCLSLAPCFTNHKLCLLLVNPYLALTISCKVNSYCSVYKVLMPDGKEISVSNKYFCVTAPQLAVGCFWALLCLICLRHDSSWGLSQYQLRCLL